MTTARKRSIDPQADKARDTDGGHGADLASPPSSEDYLARAFTHAHGDDWRYVAALGQWFEWTGTRWRPDTVARVLDLIRLVCRTEASGLDDAADARRIASDRTIRAVERLARSDPRHAARMEDWDLDTMLLNTPAGIVDLTSGKIRSSDPASLMTLLTNAAPGSGCPRWLAFLHEITGGDISLIGYLQRLAGYSLTGSTNEQNLVFLHGPGANGKSVFLTLLAHVLGSYAATAALDTFMASKHERHSTELAGLCGARLVTVTETEVNRAWAESRIKAITGGDKLRVRLLYHDFFEFTPSFKLAIAGNHRPRLTDVGEAMRRRLHLVPLDVIIPPERRDPGLVGKLKAETDGILGWMIKGCLEWQRIGLAAPKAVLEASSDYFRDEDLVGQWLAECCQLARGLKTPSMALFANWSSWADGNAAHRNTPTWLAAALKARGLASSRSATSRFWTGIGLREGTVANASSDSSDDAGSRP